jgi:hypothetical protein
MRRFVPFVLPVVVVLLSIGLWSFAYRSGRLPKIAGVDWRERFTAKGVDIPEEA